MEKENTGLKDKLVQAWKQSTNSDEKPVVKAKPIGAESKASDFIYGQHSIDVPTPFAVVEAEIEADDDCFFPQIRFPDCNVASVFINLNEKELDYTGEKFIRVPTRGVLEFDCGFSLNVIAGFKARFSINEKYSKKGLMLMLPSQHTEGRVLLTVLNMGKEFLKINNKEAVAEMWMEPVFNMDLRSI